MKTINEIIKDHVMPWCETDCIEKEWAIAAMREYGKELIDHILQHPEWIYTNHSGWEISEVMYSYESFDKLKKNLL